MSITGEGQAVETSLMEAALQQTYWHASIFFANGQSPAPLGSGHVLTGFDTAEIDELFVAKVLL